MRAASLRSLIVLLVCCLGLFAGLAWWLRGQEAAFLSSVRAQAALEPPPRPLAEVTTALRTMKLVAVEIDTTVSLQRGDSSWRGDVAAKLEVPVRLSYGTDLSTLRSESIGFSPLVAGGYVIRVPRPTRISTEVFSENEKAEVEVGWMRLRTRAGEYYLGQARKDAAAAARELVLRPEDARKVEEVTREQVGALVKSIVGERVPVRVEFEAPP